jgi:hypothetical protein
VFLAGASLAYGLDATAVGAVLGSIVAALALLAATTGLCIGCKLYGVIAWYRLRRYAR